MICRVFSVAIEFDLVVPNANLCMFLIMFFTSVQKGRMEVIPNEDERDAASFPLSMWERVLEAVVLQRSTVLRLKEYKIAHVPAGVGDLNWLQCLDLSFNMLRELPEEIGRCGCLAELFLDHNLLACLPSSIGFLSKLKVLHVQANQISYFPASILNLKELRFFKLVLNPQLFKVRQSWMERFPTLQELATTVALRNGVEHIPVEVISPPRVCSVCTRPFCLEEPFRVLRKAVLAGKKLLVLDDCVCSAECVGAIYRLNDELVGAETIAEEALPHVSQSLRLLSNILGPAYTERARVLVIPPGAGFSNDERARTLKLMCHVVWPEAPLPEDNLGECIDIMKLSLAKHKFDLLIAGSRGAAIASALCQGGYYSGRVLLLSACERLPVIGAAGSLVTCVHGSDDAIYPIFMVKDECAAHCNAQLIEMAGNGHALETLNEPAHLRGVIESALSFEGKGSEDSGASARVAQKSALLSAIKTRK